MSDSVLPKALPQRDLTPGPDPLPAARGRPPLCGLPLLLLRLLPTLSNQPNLLRWQAAASGAFREAWPRKHMPAPRGQGSPAPCPAPPEPPARRSGQHRPSPLREREGAVAGGAGAGRWLRRHHCVHGPLCLRGGGKAAALGREGWVWRLRVCRRREEGITLRKLSKPVEKGQEGCLLGERLH